MEDRAAENLWILARALRTLGFSLSIQDAVLAARSVALTQDLSLTGVHDVLAALWVSSHEQRVLFDQAYAYFASLLAGALDSSIPQGAGPWLSGIGLPQSGRTWVSWIDAAKSSQFRTSDRTVYSHSGRASSEEVLAGSQSGHSPAELPWARRLDSLPAHQVRGYRRQDVRRGKLWNLSRVLRRNRGRAEITALWRQKRRDTLRPSLFLWDASRSMDGFLSMYFQFLHRLVHTKNAVEVWTFSTRLTDVTAELRTVDPKQAYRNVFEKARDLRGGTLLASVAEALAARTGNRLSTKSDIVLITDGYDAGSPEDLANILSKMGRRSHRLIWWNPWLGRKGYEIATPAGRILAKHCDRVDASGTLSACVAAWQRLT